MNFGTMDALVRKNCGNMPTSHVFASNVADNINEAANRVIISAFAMDRRAFNCFPEIINRRWFRLTDADSNSMPLPDNLLIVTAVSCTRLTTAYNPATDTENKMVEETDAEKFGEFQKDAMGWPTQWRRDGAQLYYWPTTSTGFETYLVARGVRKEATLTQAQQTYVVGDLWHPTIVKCATAITMEQMGWPDAERWWGFVEKDITATVNPVGLEKRGDRNRMKIAGAPS